MYIILGSLLESKVHVEPQLKYGHHLGNHSVFYKEEWRGKRFTRKTRMPHPVGLVIISHTSTNFCKNFYNCARILRGIQNSHMFKGFWDIGTNFAIGGDGNIYVGRGWDVLNCHPHLSIGISFIGNYDFDNLDANMEDAAQRLLQQGVTLGKLSEDYLLVGHNQTCRTHQRSPGEYVYRKIKTWTHFYDKTINYVSNIPRSSYHEGRTLC